MAEDSALDEIIVRPLRADDAEALQASFALLSPQSRAQRFLTNVAELSPELWRRLTTADGVDHVAIAAFMGTALVGVGRFFRTEEPATAEVAVTIIDAMQGKGLGQLLIRHLVAAARERGVTKLVADMLPGHVVARRLLDKHGQLVVVRRENIDRAELTLS